MHVLLCLVVVLLVLLGYYWWSKTQKIDKFWTPYVTDQEPIRRYHAAGVPVKPWGVVNSTPSACCGSPLGGGVPVSYPGPYQYVDGAGGSLGPIDIISGPFSIADSYGGDGAAYTPHMAKGAGFTDLPLDYQNN